MTKAEFLRRMSESIRRQDAARKVEGRIGLDDILRVAGYATQHSLDLEAARRLWPSWRRPVVNHPPGLRTDIGIPGPWGIGCP